MGRDFSYVVGFSSKEEAEKYLEWDGKYLSEWPSIEEREASEWQERHKSTYLRVVDSAKNQVPHLDKAIFSKQELIEYLKELKYDEESSAISHISKVLAEMEEWCIINSS